MISEMATKEDRQAFVRQLLHSQRTVTVSEAWEAGHEIGLYAGGDAPLVKADLNAVGRRHDGFWRHINEPDRVRLKCARWADYWTARR